MIPHGDLGDPESPGGVLRRGALREQREHLPLPLREDVVRRLVALPHRVAVSTRAGCPGARTATVEAQTVLRPSFVRMEMRRHGTGQPSRARRAPEQPGWQITAPFSSSPRRTSQHFRPTACSDVIPVSCSAPSFQLTMRMSSSHANSAAPDETRASAMVETTSRSERPREPCSSSSSCGELLISIDQSRGRARSENDAVPVLDRLRPRVPV